MTHSSLVCTIILLAIENIVYLALVSGIYSSYSNKAGRRFDLLKFRPYRLYDHAFINNFPSPNGREFYKLTNKVTVTFNVMIVATFILLLLINVASV